MIKVANRYRHITGSKSISGDFDNINETFDMIEDDVVALENKQQTTTQSVNSLQTQVNGLVVSGDSSPAAAQAAIDANGHDYKNLKLRLDTEHEQVIAQLADKVPIAYVDTELNKRATKQELSQETSNTRAYVDNKISQLGNLSPKGAVPTLPDLISAYPTGTEGVYLVQQDGHWYYWNGSAWTDGGVYQPVLWDAFMTEANEWWDV